MFTFVRKQHYNIDFFLVYLIILGIKMKGAILSMNISQLIYSLIQLVQENVLISFLLVFFGLFDGVFGFVEFFESGKSLHLLGETFVIVCVLLLLGVFLPIQMAILAILLAIFIKILLNARQRGKKRNQQIEATIGQSDVTVSDNMPLTTSPSFKQAIVYIGENRPLGAIRQLRKCRGKITEKPKYYILYAEALIMLKDFDGALSKLNSITPKQLKKRKTFHHATVEKAYCYHGLYKFADEIECYNAILAKNIKEGTYYLRRAQIKQRMLETEECLPDVKQDIIQIGGSRDAFVQSAFDDLNKATQFLSKRDMHCEGMIRSHWGACLFHTGEFQKGFEILTDALKKNEFYANTYIYIGMYFFIKKRFTDAIHEMNLAIPFIQKNEQHEVSDVLYFISAQSYEAIEQYDKAIYCATQALSVFPYRSQCFHILGNCYGKMGMYTQAIECYTKAIELKPDPNDYISRASCYFNRNDDDCDKSYRDVQNAIRLGNDSASVQLQAILYKSRMDFLRNASIDKNQLDKMLELYENSISTLNLKGTIYMNYKYFEDAANFYKKALEIDPAFDVAHANLAIVLLHQQKPQPKEAAERLEKAIQISPLEKHFYVELAKCYHNMGEGLNERKTLGRLIEVNRLRSEIHRENGKAVYRLKRYQRAVNYFQMAWNEYESPFVLNDLACAYCGLEQYHQAIVCLEKALKLKEDYWLAWFNLGNCQLLLQQNELAKISYQNVIRLNHQFNRAEDMLRSMSPNMIQMVLDNEIPSPTNNPFPLLLESDISCPESL